MDTERTPRPLPDPEVVYDLVPPTPGPWRSVLLGVFVGLMAAAAAQRAGAAQRPSAAAGLLVALAAGTLLQGLFRRYVADGLALLDDRVELRHGPRTLRSLDLRRLAEVNEFETEAGPVLLLTDHRLTVAVLRARFARSGEFDALRTRLVERVRALDPSGGLGRRAAAAARQREALARRPVRLAPLLAVWLALSSLLSGWILLPALGGRPFPSETVGALSGALVRGGDGVAWGNGEWWRLVSYPFQHPTAMHATLSVVGLLWLGSFVERLAGWERAVVAFVAGLLGGAAGYMATGTPVAASGASPGIFGLVGLLSVVALRRRDEFPRVLLPRVGVWSVAMLVAPLLPGAGPLALAGDVGGLAAGALASLLLLSTPLTAEEGERAWRPLAVLALGALLVGFIGGVTHARRRHPDDDRVVAESYLRLPPGASAAALQNDTAYLLLMRPSASDEAVALGTELAESAVRLSGRRDPAILDTLAVARFRQGRPVEARGVLEEALRLDMEAPVRALLERRLADVVEGRDLQE